MASLPNINNDTTARLLRSIAEVTPQGRAVLRLFAEAKQLAPIFQLSSGLLPEVSESCSARLFDIVQGLAARHLGARRQMATFRNAMKRAVRSPEAFERIDGQLTAIRVSETTAAYVFGLCVGLAQRQ